MTNTTTTALLNKFSTNLRDALKKAQSIAMDFKHQEVKPEHVLYALLTQKGSLSAEVLTGANINPQAVQNFITEKNSSKDKDLKNFCLSKPVKDAIMKATKTAYNYNHKYIGTEHMLLGLLDIHDINLEKLLTQNSIDTNNLKNRVLGLLEGTSSFPDLAEIFGAITTKEKVKDGKRTKKPKQKESALDFFGTDLTNAKIQNSIDPVIGREEEIERIIQILCRRTKNNPILIGEAGVGKTAIVEGLAKKIINNEVPEILHNKKIYTLDMSLLIGGTIFRGEFEARFRQVLDEIKEDPNIIVFIDEIHTIIGAGSGALDAANILKPALARGDVRCIGATTFNEYKRSIENDPALERRFQPVKVSEPTEEKAIEILHGVKRNYELFHQVEISEEAIKGAVQLSKRYLQDKFLPDKAIDLLDEASAKIRINQKLSTELMEIKELEKKLSEIEQDKHQAVAEEQYEAALQFKELEKIVREELGLLKEKNKKLTPMVLGRIDYQDIAKIISQMTQIPIAELGGEEKNKLLNLEKILAKKIIGQDGAIKTISQAIRRSRTGIRNQNQPIGSFMFLGPSGVGKTELAKVIAETLFGHDALIRIDMSEFAEGFNVSKLIGAPAGYVGYKEGGKLTEAIKRKPYAVVLLDEIEKAHSDVFNLLLQVLDEGHLTDAAGKKIDFKNTIIIMTSNIGLSSFNKQAEIGFGSDRDEPTTEFKNLRGHIKDELKKHFRPEFLNRLDNTAVFNPLALKELQKIVKLKIEEFNQRLQDKNIKLKLNPAATKWLAQKNFNASFGARTVTRNIAGIENMIAEGLLEDKFNDGDVVKLGVKDDGLVLSYPQCNIDKTK